MIHPELPRHTFHIPVMGTGFTLDTPLRVGRYGISSVISLVDDILIDQMRKVLCSQTGETFEDVDAASPQARAARITAYLDLVDKLLTRQMDALRAEPFESGSDICRYYELLPPCDARTLYERMLTETDVNARGEMQDALRASVVRGDADVNIMTKLDCSIYVNGEKQPIEFNDAMSAVRGVANSTLETSVILSAGINQHLYGYLAGFTDFHPDENGHIRKRITLKVSDYRSALIQGKYLARHGLWVSEFRIESGLNCGGHAFPTRGLVLGPILEEFKQKREELVAALYKVYSRARVKHGLRATEAPPLRVTVQGGLVTADEHALLLSRYGVDSVGWATPFLLAPDVVVMDDKHLRLLAEATEKEALLGSHSPLNVPYWSLSTCDSETTREQRIAEGKPGSSCPKHFLEFEHEFTPRPICSASRAYKRLKLAALREADLPDAERAALEDRVLQKACICHDLGGSLTRKYEIDDHATPAICCGPTIAFFTEATTLQPMVDHIYGRAEQPGVKPAPHVFVRELRLYTDYLRDLVNGCAPGIAPEGSRFAHDQANNLLEAISYYGGLVELLSASARESFKAGLEACRQDIETAAAQISD